MRRKTPIGCANTILKKMRGENKEVCWGNDVLRVRVWSIDGIRIGQPRGLDADLYKDIFDIVNTSGVSIEIHKVVASLYSTSPEIIHMPAMRDLSLRATGRPQCLVIDIQSPDRYVRPRTVKRKPKTASCTYLQGNEPGIG